MYEEHQQLSIPTIETYLHDSPPTADHHNSIVSKPSRFCTSRKSFNGKQKYEKLLPAKRCCSGIFFLLLPDPHPRAVYFFHCNAGTMEKQAIPCSSEDEFSCRVG